MLPAGASTLQLVGLFLLMGSDWSAFIKEVTGNNQRNADKVTGVLKNKASAICETTVKSARRLCPARFDRRVLLRPLPRRLFYFLLAPWAE